MFYKYVLCLGFLDGVPGLIYCGLQGIQFFQIKAKMYEAKIAAREIRSVRSRELTHCEGARMCGISGLVNWGNRETLARMTRGAAASRAQRQRIVGPSLAGWFVHWSGQQAIVHS